MKLLHFIKFVLLFSLLAQSSLAEYRVYQYAIKSKLERYGVNGSYLVTSTLDPVSYLSYHGGSNSIKVDLLRTWTCKGYTGNGKKVCTAPLEKSGIMEERKTSL